MNIPDNGITPALFQKWIYHWNDTCVEIEHILQAIIMGLESEPDLDSLNNEQRGREGAKLDFFLNIYIKSSQGGNFVRGIRVTVWKREDGSVEKEKEGKEALSCFFVRLHIL